jgi:dihydrofolate synthase/folylpolyglutamate synthase
MKTINKQTTPKDVVTTGKQRSYNEIIEFLDQNWKTNLGDTNLTCIKKLDQAFGSPSQKLNSIIVGGTNGKSLTINFAAQLLKEEGVQVGTFYTPHLLTYNERIGFNNELISNKTFTEIGNDVINTAENLGLKANSFELLTMMALLYFKANNADVVLLETNDQMTSNAITICSPKIAAITRVTSDEVNAHDEVSRDVINSMLTMVKSGTHVISADQSKLNLQVMLEMVKEKGGIWGMPIRKLAPLNYPFEQLHGRCAALAERITHIYVNQFANKDAIVVGGTLLTKQKGQRGRPTLEAKKEQERNPKRTIEQFWREAHHTLPGHFQLLDKEKPSLLLDVASNLDAFKNLLLGIRLLHYQRPLKGLTLILGSNNPALDTGEFLKLLRYFFKKTSGSVIVCPIEQVPGHKGEASWDVEKITNEIKGMKIKARSSKNLKEAFEAATKSVDERHGLVVIAGSPSLISEFWRYKGIKKL